MSNTSTNRSGGPFSGLQRAVVASVVVVALVQTAVLGWMVFERVAHLRNGRVITLPIIPVDPRHIFKGDYVRLSYPITRVDASLLKADRPTGNAPLYVILKRGKAGGSGETGAGSSGETGAGERVWQVVAISQTYLRSTSDDQIVLKARLSRRSLRGWPASAQITLKYGIESYFLEEGTGLRLEKLVRKKKMAAQISVDTDGEAAIKGLLIDGKLQYEEPLF